MAEADLPRPGAVGIASGDVDAAAQPARLSNTQRKALFFSVPLLLVIGLALYWLTLPATVSTDNAYVKQSIVSVGSDVVGRIIAVDVAENQQVKAGQRLFQVDPDPYRVALAAANAEVATAQVDVSELRATYNATNVDIAKARTDIAFAQTEYQRQRELAARGFTTKVKLEAAQHALDAARAQYATAMAEAAKARSALAAGSDGQLSSPKIAEALAKRSKAALDLSRTVIVAPVAGRISRTERLQVGQIMVTGFPALSIVVNDRSWVEANFKEKDLEHIRPGQRAELKVDAYPGQVLRGHVESIGGGTGAQFSVLPPQNANGNWVKVTQRVPVRIAIDEKSDMPLIAGLSTEVTIYVGD